MNTRSARRSSKIQVNRLIVGALLLHVWTVQAQNCPAGIPSAGNPLCIPPDRENSPYYQGGSVRGGKQYPQPSLYIRWGSIAVDQGKQVAGFSIDEKTDMRAQKAALKDCKEKGGDHCGIAMIYNSISDQCVGLAVGEKGKFGAARGGTEGEALYLALESCKAQGIECEVHYANCVFDNRVE